MILSERILSDIRQWQQLYSDLSNLVCVTNENHYLSVSKRHPFGSFCRHIQRKNDSILVKVPASSSDSSEEILHRLSPTLNKKGECRLMLGSEELGFWQASRLILEPVLLG